MGARTVYLLVSQSVIPARALCKFSSSQSERGRRRVRSIQAPIGSHRQRLAPTRAAVSPVEDFERDSAERNTTFIDTFLTSPGSYTDLGVDSCVMREMI